MNKRTAIYCRTSAPDQAALAYQRTALQDYAKAQGFDTLIRYEDNGYTGSDAERPAFCRLEQDIRDGKVARVLTSSISRLGRNTSDVMKWLVWLRRHGAEIYTLDNQAEWNPLLAALEGGIANE